ncbi:MAG: DUF929 family protein [Acidimicrobiales bacterium]
MTDEIKPEKKQEGKSASAQGGRRQGGGRQGGQQGGRSQQVRSGRRVSGSSDLGISPGASGTSGAKGSQSREGGRGGSSGSGGQRTGTKSSGERTSGSGSSGSGRAGQASHPGGRSGAGGSRPYGGRDAKTGRNRQVAGGPGQGRGGGRSTTFMAWGAVFVVIVIVAVVVVVKLSGSSSSSAPNTGSSQPAPASVVKDVTTIPLSEFNSVGVPSKSLASNISFSPPIKITKSQPSLVNNGKPEVFYFGAESCPFCATERWPVVVALSRFGTFSHLAVTTSSATDVYPQTNTFSFYKSSFTSPYLSFVPVEIATNQPDPTAPTGYKPLMTPTKAENALVAKYDGPPYTGPQTSTSSAGAIPFVDIGNKVIISGASYTPALLSGLNWYQIASQIKSGKTTLGKAAIGAANYITGAICSITKDQPSSVCTSAPVKTAQSNLGLG